MVGLDYFWFHVLRHLRFQHVLALAVLWGLAGCAAPQTIEDDPPEIAVETPVTVGELHAGLATLKTETVSEINEHTENVQEQATVAVKSRIDTSVKEIKGSQNIGAFSGGGGIALLGGLGAALILAVLLYVILKHLTQGVKDSVDTGQPVTDTIAEAVGGGALRKLLNVLLAWWGTRA